MAIFIIRSTAIPSSPGTFILIDAVGLLLSINHKAFIKALKHFVPSDVTEQEPHQHYGNNCEISWL